MEQLLPEGTTVYHHMDYDQDTPGLVVSPPYDPDPDDEPSVYVSWSREYLRWEYIEDLRTRR